jgi:hypothetical protein
MFILSNVSSKVDYPISEKIIFWMQAFNYEISLYDDLSMDCEPWRLYTERPMIGFQSAGIIRSDSNLKKAVLQEFGVHEAGVYNGRCDLIVISEGCVFLFEAKFLKGSYGIKEWSKVEYDKLLLMISDQLNSYYKSEESAYDNFNSVYLVSIGFMRVECQVDKLSYYLANDTIKLPNEINSFYSAISSEVLLNSEYRNASCLEIFGKVEKVK